MERLAAGLSEAQGALWTRGLAVCHCDRDRPCAHGSLHVALQPQPAVTHPCQGHTYQGMEVTTKGTVELLGMVQSPFLPLQLQEQSSTKVR